MVRLNPWKSVIMIVPLLTLSTMPLTWDRTTSTALAVGRDEPELFDPEPFGRTLTGSPV
jgi:hypothetical protein